MSRFAFADLVAFLASPRVSQLEPVAPLIEPVGDPAGAAFLACAESLEQLSRHIGDPELLAGAGQLRSRRLGN